MSDEKHEKIIAQLKQQMETFIISTIKTGDALRELLEDEHWKDTHESVDSFCKETFGFDETRARIIIQDSAILKKDPSKAFEMLGIPDRSN